MMKQEELVKDLILDPLCSEWGRIGLGEGKVYIIVDKHGDIIGVGREGESPIGPIFLP